MANENKFVSFRHVNVWIPSVPDKINSHIMSARKEQEIPFYQPEMPPGTLS
jgi:hypothetical protein